MTTDKRRTVETNHKCLEVFWRKGSGGDEVGGRA